MNTKDIARFHKVVSDVARWHILEYLKFNKNVSTEELAKYLKIDLSTLSFHLAKMKEVKLLRITKKGKNLYYNANFKTLETIYKYMEQKVILAFNSWSHFEFTREQILEIYGLYSDHIRMKIFELIVEKPGITGKEIKAAVKQPEANISYHVKKLLDGHLIACRKIQNQRFYWANLRVMSDFHAWIGKTRHKNVWLKHKK